MESTTELQQRVRFLCATNGIEGSHVNHIIQQLKRHSADDFICGEYLQKPHQIPDIIWSKLCEHFHARVYRPFQRQNIDPDTIIVHHKQKQDIFIPNNLTGHIIGAKLIAEEIPSARRLYQYLNWKMRISKMAQTTAYMKGQGGRRLLLINVELHDQRGHELYALCTPNDMVLPKSPSWKLRYLLTGNELTDLLGVDYKVLPRGVRAVSAQFENYRKSGYSQVPNDNPVPWFFAIFHCISISVLI